MTKLQFLKELRVLNTICTLNKQNVDLENFVTETDFPDLHQPIIDGLKSVGAIFFRSLEFELVVPKIFNKTLETCKQIEIRYSNQIQSVCNELKIIPCFNPDDIKTLANTSSVVLYENEVLQDIVNCIVNKECMNICICSITAYKLINFKFAVIDNKFNIEYK